MYDRFIIYKQCHKTRNMYKFLKYSSYTGAGLAMYFGVCGLKTGLVLMGAFTSFCFGSLVVLLYLGKLKSDATYGQSKPPLAPRSTGIPKIVKAMNDKKSVNCNHDKRLTGAHNIDEELQAVIDHVFNDYIKVWYNVISYDGEFLLELRKAINYSISNLASRTKEVDWTTFLTQTLVDELASHIKLYRRADQKVHQDLPPPATSSDDHLLTTELDELERTFFEFEKDMEDGKFCREFVCSDIEMEKRYLQDATEALLYFILPDAEFDNQMCRFLIREVLVNKVIYPTVDMISDPDYINQYVIALCADSTLTSDTFISTIRLCDSIEELQAVRQKVNEEIARTRSKDTGGADDGEVKRALSSLNFVMRLCESRITRIARSHSVAGGLEESLDSSEKLANMKLLPFECVFNSDVCIQYFNDFLLTTDRIVYLNMMFDIDCFNKIAVQQLLQNPDDPEAIQLAHGMIQDIYEKYFSETIPGLQIQHACVESIQTALEQQKISPRVFDGLHEHLVERLEKFYDEFKNHTLYIKMLRDLEMDAGSISSLPEEFSDVGSQLKSLDEDRQMILPKLHATIEKTGIVTESKADGKTYAVYKVYVAEDDNRLHNWTTSRRYSDFYDLYVIVCEKYQELKELPFPEKKTFNTLNTDFLDRRAKQLNGYLQNLLESSIYHEHISLRQLVHEFLQPQDWVKPKDLSTMKMGAFWKKVGTSATKLPDAFLTDVLGKGFGKIKTKLSLAPSLNKNQFDSSKVRATLDTEDEDNIPMRIMLLLLDEVFDLRKKNQWLRRRIVAILRQIIKAAYGDRINRRIVGHVETLISADQVTEYVKQFKDSLWPSGVPAEPREPRDVDTKLRTSTICKAKMIGSIPDELRTMIGSETSKLGVLRVFAMFQHKRLNKRIVYTILEAVVKLLFEHSKFESVFKQIHSKPELRGRTDSSFSQPSL